MKAFKILLLLLIVACTADETTNTIFTPTNSIEWNANEVELLNLVNQYRLIK